LEGGTALVPKEFFSRKRAYYRIGTYVDEDI